MRKLLALFMVVVGAALGPVAAGAEDVETLKRDLLMMREQLDVARRQYEERMQRLGERIRALERERPPSPGAISREPAVPGEPSAPGPGPSPAPARAAAGAPVAPEPLTIRQILAPRQPFALASPGQALLFDLGVSGDFVTDFTSGGTPASLATFPGRQNQIFPQEVSLGAFGRVDPYASAVVRISASEGSDGQVTVNLDEANFTLLALPLGTTARIGMMRPRFGILNTVHQDDLPQVDRPDVLVQFFGEEELDGEKGVEAAWVLPLPIYQELSIGVFDGDNETAFGWGSLRNPLVLGRLRTFFELGEWGGLQVDLSGATGVDANEQRNTVVDIGLKYKWSPVAGYGFPVVTLSGEGVYGNRLVASNGGAEQRWRRWGLYAYSQVDWSKRWAVGLRYDWTQIPTAPGQEWALSPYVQFKPSEFLRFRVQYKHTEGTRSVAGTADEIFLQGTFILGAHPTERF